MTIIAANGHFHSRGVKFEMFPSDAQNQPGANFYTSTEWADPVFFKDLNVPVVQNGRHVAREELSQRYRKALSGLA